MVDELAEEIAEGLKAIKLSGLTDKANWRKAAKIVKAMGFDETATWTRKNPERYMQLVTEGYMKPESWMG